METEQTWYYETNGKRLGPISETEIVDLITNGTLNAESAVWKRGMKDWEKLEDSELKQFLYKNTPPPLRGSAVKNSIVWFLAFAPIIGKVFESWIAYSVNDSELVAEMAYRSNKYFWVTLILNVGLCYLDSKRLAKAGHDTSAFGAWAFVVPVYLFKRAKALRQSPAYFWVWLVAFIFALLNP